MRDERPHHHHPHISQWLQYTHTSHRTLPTTREEGGPGPCAGGYAFCLLSFADLPLACFIRQPIIITWILYSALPACTHSYPLLHTHKRSQGSSTMMLTGCRSAGSNSSRQLLGRAAAQAAASSPSSLLHPHPTISSSSMASALGSRRHISDKLFIRST